MGRTRGFSLVELMVALAVMAILTCIAYPMYNGYMAGGKRSEASTNLEQLRLLMEDFRSVNGSYGANATHNGTATVRAFLPEWQPPSGGGAANYDYAVTVSGGGTNFVAGAIPNADAPPDVVVDAGTGAVATIDQANVRAGVNFW